MADHRFSIAQNVHESHCVFIVPHFVPSVAYKTLAKNSQEQENQPKKEP
jgi:hypothetical protein